jgi:hypothetical protein
MKPSHATSLVPLRTALPTVAAVDIKTGYYLLSCGRIAHVAVARQRTSPRWQDDGAVHVDFDNGSMTAMFFAKFFQLRPQRILDPSEPSSMKAMH